MRRRPATARAATSPVTRGTRAAEAPASTRGVTLRTVGRVAGPVRSRTLPEPASRGAARSARARPATATVTATRQTVASGTSGPTRAVARARARARRGTRRVSEERVCSSPAHAVRASSTCRAAPGIAPRIRPAAPTATTASATPAPRPFAAMGCPARSPGTATDTTGGANRCRSGTRTVGFLTAGETDATAYGLSLSSF